MDQQQHIVLYPPQHSEPDGSRTAIIAALAQLLAIQAVDVVSLAFHGTERKAG